VRPFQGCLLGSLDHARLSKRQTDAARLAKTRQRIAAGINEEELVHTPSVIESIGVMVIRARAPQTTSVP
jgi:hypothetical protein